MIGFPPWFPYKTSHEYWLNGQGVKGHVLRKETFDVVGGIVCTSLFHEPARSHDGKTKFFAWFETMIFVGDDIVSKNRTNKKEHSEQIHLEYLTRIKTVLDVPFKDLPLFINEPDFLKNLILKKRLEEGC